ncbi:TIGR02391 family protein [Methanobacterium sp.]|uniref:TIGR02391 family protein n=1 Tax=Methanobacterium sp. TaxID=2164 RepID=UPI003C771441
MIKLDSFSLSALEALAKIIGARYTGTEMTDFFRKAGFPEIVHDGGTKWRFAYSSLEELQDRPYGPYNIAKIIEKLCDPQEYFGNADYREDLINEVNEILSHYELEVKLDTGKISINPSISPTLSSYKTQTEITFDNRNYHFEIRKHGRDLFIENKYFHAVFECCKAFDKYVQDKSKIENYGSRLMSSALSLSGPLKINSQVSETDKNEQLGVMNLCIGLTKAIRNTGAHEPELNWPLNQEDALDILSLLSFLWRKIDSAVYFNENLINQK